MRLSSLSFRIVAEAHPAGPLLPLLSAGISLGYLGLLGVGMVVDTYAESGGDVGRERGRMLGHA